MEPNFATRRLIVAQGIFVLGLALWVSSCGGGGGSSSKSTGFGPSGPTITSLSPSTGPVSGGTSVVIAGTNFDTSTAPTVTFGGIAATNVTASSSSSLTATTPAATGTFAVPVVVKNNSDGETATSPTPFTYTSAPTISSVTPNTGPPAGGTQVTIQGSNFSTTSAPSVTFGGVPATSVSVATASTMTAATPAGTGTVSLVVTNPDGESSTLSSGFVYATTPAPSITSISPNVGWTGGGTAVTITGANLQTGDTVQFGTTPAASVTVTSSTQITATTPVESAGTVNVIVTNTNGQSANAASAFTFYPHLVTLGWNVSPTVGVIGYNVFRSTTSGGEGATPINSSLVAGCSASTTPNCEYIDVTVQPGNTYYYAVTAVVPGGVQSAPSTETQTPGPIPSP